MQGPMSVLNVITVPPGATNTQARLVIDGIRGAIFVYANGGPAGALVGSWASVGGVDPYGNSYPAGFFTTAGGSTIEGNNYVLNSNGLFMYNQAASGPTTITFQAGSGQWTAPTGVTTVDIVCGGGNGGGGNGAGGAGGGGEYAEKPSGVVTPGTSYNYSVGPGGTGGAQGGVANNGGNGGNSTFTDNASTVTAHGGHGGTGGGGTGSGTGGAGGSGSTNAIHHNGGNGGNGFFAGSGGGGGGGSAGPATAGNNGHNATISGGGNGATAVAGGGAGANGGGGGQAGGSSTAQPGGGGGGGGVTPVNVGNAGGNGAGGYVSLTYTPTSALALVVSICGIPTTDPELGVQCPIGVTVYNANNQQVQASLNSGNIQFIDTANAVQAPGLIGLATVGVTNDSLQLNSPANAPTDVQVFLALQKVATGNLGVLKLMNALFNIATAANSVPTPTSGVNIGVDSGHNLNIIGDNIGGNNHLLIFNFDLALRSGVTPSAPTSGWRITADNNNNLVLTPAASTGQLLELISSGLWLHDNNAALLAPAAGVIVQVDAGGNRLQQVPSTVNPAGNIPAVGLATFPNNSIGNATLGNLSSMTVNANDAEVGSIFEVHVDGNWTEATGTAVTFRFTGGFGSVNNATSLDQTIGTSGFNAGGTGRFVGFVRAVCVTTGSGGTWRFVYQVTVTPNATPGNSVTICDETPTPVAASTIVNQSLAIRFAWGSATGSPNLTCQTAFTKRHN